MKKTAATERRELKITYGTDLCLCVMNFLVCSVLCAGGSEWLGMAGVIALLSAVLPLGFRRLYYKDEYTPKSVGAVMTVYRLMLTALLLYGIDFFLIA